MKEITFPYAVKVGRVAVKVYRVKSATSKDGVYFQVAGQEFRDGKRKRKVVSFADFDDAKTEAKRIADLLSAGEVAALDLGANERAAYGQAIETLRPTGDSLVTATARYAEAVELLGSGNRLIDAIKFFKTRNPDLLPSKTVAELIDEMIQEKQAHGKSPRYIDDLRSRLDRFAKDVPGVRAADVDTPTVKKWLSGLGLSAQSYRNYRTVLYGLFAYAEECGYIARGCNPVQFVKCGTVKAGETEIFSPAEFDKLLRAASPEFLPSLAIGGFAGLRSAEIQRLDWSNIDLKGRFITLSASKAKTGMRRIVPICDALAEWLADYAHATGPVWPGNDDTFVNAQRRTAAQAGLKWKGNALRHSYASYRLAMIADVARVAQELGNSAVIVDRHYKELARPQVAAEWFAIRPATVTTN